MSNGLLIVMKHDFACIYLKDTLLAQGVKLENNLIKLFINYKMRNEVNYVSVAYLKLWHERLGNANGESIKKLARSDAVVGLSVKNEDNFFCENCPIGKQSRLSFKKRENSREIVGGEVVHTDLRGPIQTVSVGDARFFMLFKDESSGFRTVDFLKHEDDAFEALVK